MRTSGIFEVHHFNIITKSSQELRLLFVGDIHRDSPNHAADEWQDFLRYARTLKNAYVLLMGDYLDSASTSERECLGNITSRMHETFLHDLESLQTEKIKLIANELSCFKNRIIGAINGNHYFNFADGTNSDQKLCGLLGCKYLGVSAFIRLYFTTNSTSRAALDVWAHHGAGAGRLIGGSINRVDQMREFANADIYVQGDDHNRLVVPATPRFELRHTAHGGLEMDKREAWLIRSGSFLRGYAPGKVSYIHDKGSGPRSIGHAELLVTITKGHRTISANIRGSYGPS
jgi:hypothetical protein